MNAAGLVLVAGGISAANEAIFVPMESHPPKFNWQNDTALFRLIPATIVLALVLTGIEKMEPPLGKGLAGLVLLAVIVVPMGKAPSPLETAGKVFGG